MSFLNSRPSHIQAGNSNVPLPSLTSLVSSLGDARLIKSARAFLSTCRLSQIVAQLQVKICTVRGQEKTRQDKVAFVISLENAMWDFALEWSDDASAGQIRKPGVSKYCVRSTPKIVSLLTAFRYGIQTRYFCKPSVSDACLGESV